MTGHGHGQPHEDELGTRAKAHAQTHGLSLQRARRTANETQTTLQLVFTLFVPPCNRTALSPRLLPAPAWHPRARLTCSRYEQHSRAPKGLTGRPSAASALHRCVVEEEASENLDRCEL